MAGPMADRLAPKTLYRFLAGADSDFVPMSAAEAAGLHDPMAALLHTGEFPLTVQKLLAALDEGGRVPVQASFLVSEAGQIPPEKAPGLTRDIRFAITRGRGSDIDLAVSTSAVGDPRQVFLQVLAWDDDAGVFNYYMRVGETWAWVGNSQHALEEPTRGNGCFDSHVNGSLVMKELKQPWLNWQSQNATILVADGDPLRDNPLYRSLSGAERLEALVRSGIRRWTASRIKATVDGTGTIAHADRLLRHLCTTTTVNLTSTLTESAAVVDDPATANPLTLPLGFWLNNNVLLDVLEIPAGFTPPAVDAQRYTDSLTRHGFALVEGSFRQPGDSFFAFVVPEASAEDTEVVAQLMKNGILTPHFAASLLMVDFPNPVFSPRRAALLAHMPKTAQLNPAGGGLSQQLAERIRQAAQGRAGSPEAEFMANWDLAETAWPDAFAARINAYLAAVARNVATDDGFDRYVRLAESRRREFRAMRLNEFALTLPVTTIPSSDALLQMQEDATVVAKS
jgi:hypothetical protein